MQVKIFPTKDAMGSAAAGAGAAVIRSALVARGAANIILATGASQFEMLSHLVQAADIDWTKVTCFHLDEYVGMPISHGASFRKYLKERFVEQLPAPPAAFHYIDAENDCHAECDRLGGLIAQHPIDVAFIGIGENAHLAFNDPPADFATETPYLVVELDEACRRQQQGEGWFATLADVPTQAISMSVRQILKSQVIVCSVPDERKAQAVQAAIEGTVTADVPASILQQHENTTVYLDQPAASLLAKDAEINMPDAPSVILSGFADEAANHKTAVEQFAAFAALGLQFYSLRFIDVGNGVKNVMKLTRSEIAKIRHLEGEYELNVASIGSPIGKVKLVDVDDGSGNAYVPFSKYLNKDVAKCCELAHAFETKLIRGFSFYHPRGSDPREHLPQVIDQLGQIAEACHRSDLTFGLEIEANLVGQSGELLAEIHRKVNHPALVLIFDAGNIITQGCSPWEVFQQYEAMKPGMGWMHIKDYRDPNPMQRTDHVDEEALKHFVPADIGDSAHEQILKDFRELIPKLERKLKRRGIPGVFLDLEPHVKGGGQFGGFSGPDGFGVALRGLCRVLDYVGIDYHLRDFDDVQAARGF